jgi:radical S-adenosyl methionine domain-containing protein 2
MHNQKKVALIMQQLVQGVHPQALGAKKIWCCHHLYRIRIGKHYRLLVSFVENKWQAVELCTRQQLKRKLKQRRRHSNLVAKNNL